MWVIIYLINELICSTLFGCRHVYLSSAGNHLRWNLLVLFMVDRQSVQNLGCTKSLLPSTSKTYAKKSFLHCLHCSTSVRSYLGGNNIFFLANLTRYRVINLTLRFSNSFSLPSNSRCFKGLLSSPEGFGDGCAVRRRLVCFHKEPVGPNVATLVKLQMGEPLLPQLTSVQE